MTWKVLKIICLVSAIWMTPLTTIADEECTGEDLARPQEWDYERTVHYGLDNSQWSDKRDAQAIYDVINNVWAPITGLDLGGDEVEKIKWTTEGNEGEWPSTETHAGAATAFTYWVLEPNVYIDYSMYLNMFEFSKNTWDARYLCAGNPNWLHLGSVLSHEFAHFVGLDDAPPECEDAETIMKEISLGDCNMWPTDLDYAALEESSGWPAAVYEWVRILSTGTGVEVSWLGSHESTSPFIETKYWVVQCVVDGGVVAELVMAPEINKTHYECELPWMGTECDYRLVEYSESSEVTTIAYGKPSRVAGAPREVVDIPMGEVGFNSRAVYSDQPRPDDTPLGGRTHYHQIVCPEFLQSQAWVLANFWWTQGVAAYVQPVSYGTTEAVEYLLSWLDSIDQLDSVLLLGAARDWELTEEHCPECETDPENDLIETFYVEDLDMVRLINHHHYATDLPYADLDDDGLPDVPLGRIPTISVEETESYIDKVISYVSGGYQAYHSRATVLVYDDSDTFPEDSHLTRAIGGFTDDVLMGMGASFVVQADDVVDPYDLPTIAVDHVNAGRGLVVATAVNSTPRKIGAGVTGTNWFETPDDFVISDLTATGENPLMMFMSCHLGMNDRMRVDGSHRLCEEMLFHSTLGAVAVVGPSRATWQVGNRWVTQELLEELYLPDISVGEAFMNMQRELIQRIPAYSDVVSSYSLMADPLVHVWNAVDSPIGVDEVPAVTSLSMQAFPNPFNPTVTILVQGSKDGGTISMKIHDITGRTVKDFGLIDSDSSGFELVWDGTSNEGLQAASGVYFATATNAEETISRKLVLLK